MPAGAALSTVAAGVWSAAAAAVAAPPTEARPGVTTATGRSLDTREDSGTGSGPTTPVTRMAAPAAAVSKEATGAIADHGSATVSNTATSTAQSSATAAAAAEG
jgi:hypothetical protein